MTVGELIARLQEFDKELPVCEFDPESGTESDWNELSTVSLSTDSHYHPDSDPPNPVPGPFVAIG